MTEPQVSVVRNDSSVTILLGRPRPNLQEQSRILQEARIWLYKKVQGNIVQTPLESSTGRVGGWELQANTRHPNRKGIRKWLRKYYGEI